MRQGGRFFDRSAALGALPNAGFIQNLFERAKTRESSLEEIEADERREKQPPRADKVAESQTGQDQCAGHEIDDALNTHKRRLPALPRALNTRNTPG